MKTFFTPNIGNGGRLLRGLAAVGLFVGAGFAFQTATWLGIVLVVSGGLVLFEALRGWCVMRACGIKTRL